MLSPRRWLWLALLCAGCHGFTLVAWDEKKAEAGKLWEDGQAAMRAGQAEEAIRCYKQSLALDGSMDCNHLSLAAAYVEKKDTETACAHLGQYLKANPEQHLLRSRYAELLLRIHRVPDARRQFERTIVDVQESEQPSVDELIHCHSRLMELAEQAGDAYGEFLHRGIGLLLLAQKRGQFAEVEGELPVEGLLCKAAAELTLAQRERPERARPAWYLYRVWTLLGQQQPATQRLREAQAAAVLSDLTPAEERNLHLIALQSADVSRSSHIGPRR